MKNIIHNLVTKSGQEYKARILFTKTEDAHRMNRNMPQDFLLYLFEIEGKKVWLNNYNAKLKYGRNRKWYYEINEQANTKIKKAL